MEQDASAFLKERIRQQAQAEGVALFPDEEVYLELACAGRTQEAYEALKSLKEHESIQEFGRRLAGLLMRAYEKDCAADPQAEARYMQGLQSFLGGRNLFSLIAPLMFRYGHAQSGPAPAGFSQPMELPRESSGAWKFVLILLILAGLVLWMVITRR